MFSEFVFKLDLSNNFESVLSFSDNLRGFPASCKTLFPFLPCDGNSHHKYSITDNRNEGFSRHMYIRRHSTLLACDGLFHYSKTYHI